jgi:hypothetical protein
VGQISDLPARFLSHAAGRSEICPTACATLFLAAALGGCGLSQAHSTPSIEITRVPPAGEGAPQAVEPIEGRVSGARPDQRIVLFARSGVWWVQPFALQPFTAIQPDSKWKNSTHPGSAYAALLVDSRYRPPLKSDVLPQPGGSVLAVATTGAGTPLPLKTIQFSGYQWEIRGTAGGAGFASNFYGPSNAWTDGGGSLHLRIARQGQQWANAEVKLTRSLGYGSYRFMVRDVSHLEPAAVLSMFTWDDFGPPREMDIEISQWGEPEDKNAQYVIQPYVVPANTVRFNAPAGTVTYWIDWQPGRAAFRTVRGSSSMPREDAVFEHVFTSGIPSPGNERIHVNLYVFENKRHPLRGESEVIIDKFEFLP